MTNFVTGEPVSEANVLPVNDVGGAGATALRDINPDDNNDLPDGPCRAIRCGGSGNVVIIAKDDEYAVTFYGVTAGEVIDVQARRVVATGTTAAHLVAMY